MSDDAPPGVPDWVVTYGDMMSLLLTFFIMLVSMSEVASESKYRAILESLHQYLGYRTGPAGPPGQSFPLNSLIEALQTLGSHTNTELGRGGVRVRGPAGDQIRVFGNREGERLRAGDLVLFRPGRADLTDEARTELRTIARNLAGKPNKVEIRAHVAPSPEVTPDDAGLLSYRRGRTVVGFLESAGIAHERLRITAGADTEPLPDRGDEQPLPHDRVEVLLLDEFADTYIGPRAVTR